MVEVAIERGWHRVEFGNQPDLGIFLIGEAIVTKPAQQFGAGDDGFEVALLKRSSFCLAGFCDQAFAGDWHGGEHAMK